MKDANRPAGSRREFWIPLRSGAFRISVQHWPLIIVGIVLAVFGFQTGRELFFRLALLVAALFVSSLFWAVYSVFTFRLARELVTPRSQVGRLAEERFLVHNTGLLTKIWIEILDDSELPLHSVSRVLNALGAQARWTWSVRTLCRRRGRFRLGPITVSCGDPFGVLAVERRLPDTTTWLTVFPATADLPAFATPGGHLPGGDALHRRTHNITTNVSGTREYVPGDSFNRIHWASTARTDRLIVKEFELDPVADVWIFLDLEQAVQVGTDADILNESRDLSALWLAPSAFRLPPSTEEYSVTLAASAARYYLRKQRSVGLVAYGDAREVVQPDRGERQVNRLLEVLAVLRGQGHTPFSHVLSLESARLTRSVTCVVITPSVEPAWVKAVRESKRRGLRVIAVIVDPHSFGGRGQAQSAATELLANGIPCYVVRQGDDLNQALSRTAQQRRNTDRRRRVRSNAARSARAG